MTDFSRIPLSGSTHGQPIKVVETATPGTLIHTAIASTSNFDEVYLWVTNTHTSDVTLTLEFGGVTDPDHLICKAVTIPAKSPPIPVCPGLTLRNSLAVRAFASEANRLIITGHVNRGQ